MNWEWILAWLIYYCMIVFALLIYFDDIANEEKIVITKETFHFLRQLIFYF